MMRCRPENTNIDRGGGASVNIGTLRSTMPCILTNDVINFEKPPTGVHI